MKTIELTRGKVTLVDDEDYGALSAFKWSAHKRKTTWYAGRNTARVGSVKGDRTTIWMHRVVAGNPDKAFDVDHWDNDGLNNTRKNLRTCTRSQNLQNQRGRGGTSSFKGVHKPKGVTRWRATIQVLGKMKHLGYYDTEVAAHEAYKIASVRFFGEYANWTTLEQRLK